MNTLLNSGTLVRYTNDYFDVRTILIKYVLLMLFMGTTGCTTLKRSYNFNDQYLIYTTSVKTDTSVFEAPFYYAVSGDTIRYISTQFGLHDWIAIRVLKKNGDTSAISIIGPSSPEKTYKIVKKSNWIFFEQYSEDEGTELIKMYPTQKKDTLRKRDGTHRVYLGDTIVKLHNTAISCYKYLETMSAPPAYTRLYYLEKNHLLPILIKTEYARENMIAFDFNKDMQGTKTSYTLRYTLQKEEVTSPEWSPLLIRE